MGLAPALYDVVVSLVVSGVGENAGAAASCGGECGRKVANPVCDIVHKFTTLPAIFQLYGSKSQENER